MPPAAGREPGARNTPGTRADRRRGLSALRVACRGVAFVLCLSVGLILPPTTHAQTTEPSKAAQAAAKPQRQAPRKSQSAPPKSQTQRIRELEQKVFQAVRYIEGLHRELQKLKRSAGLPTTPPVGTQAPPAPSPGAQQAPPAPGTQQAFQGREPDTPSAAARERRRQGAERLEEAERVSQEQERPELQAGFLRQANAVLIPKGHFEIDPALTFTHTNRNQLLVRGLDLIENIFIGTIEVGRLRRSVLTHSYSLRYGLTDRIQLTLNLPYQRSFRQAVLAPEVQRQLGEETESRTSDGGLGDIGGGVSVHLLREGEWLPDLIVSATLKSDTGTSPFEVEQGSLATGTGFWGLRGGFTLVKISDPAVLYLSAGYFYHHPSDEVPGFREVDPPDNVDVGFGISYALNPFLSLTTRFTAGFTEKTVVDDFEVDGSDETTASLGLGVTYALSGRTSLDISTEFGLTDDSPDFVVRVSTPIHLALPDWGEWKNWRLSRIFRF